MTEKKLHRVMTIVEGEVKPTNLWRESFDQIFPERQPPVLRDYRLYVVECNKMKIDPLSEEKWCEYSGRVTGRS